jgi:hypothetical protein
MQALQPIPRVKVLEKQTAYLAMSGESDETITPTLDD